MAAELDFVRSGKSGGPALLMIHAMGADRTFWDACRAALDDAFDCIAVDLRGAGRSAPISTPVGFADHAADLEQVRVRLGLERVVAVGCAVGAMVAATYAARYRDRCAALVLSNPGLRTLPGAREALAARARLVREQGLEAVAGRTVEAAFGKEAGGAQAREFSRAFLAQDAVSYACAIEGMLDADITPLLAEIGCPVLIVGGGRDTLLPVADHAVPLHAGLAGSELALMEDAAHFAPYQRPAAFAGLVSEFLGRRPGAGA